MSVSQSLNTGEPVHQVVHSSLIERLFYHHHKHRHHHDSRDAGDKASKEADAVSKDIARLSSLEFLYYATAIIAIYELLKVSVYQRYVRHHGTHCAAVALG